MLDKFYDLRNAEAIVPTFFQEYFFFGRTILKLIWNKKSPRGSGGMLPLKNFENLHGAIAILVLFE